MDERAGMIIFFTIFISLYGLLHVYVLGTMAKSLKLTRGPTFFVIVALLSISYIVAAGLQTAYGSIWTKLLYIATNVWMGLIFIMFCLTIIYQILQWITRNTIQYNSIIVIVIAVILTIYAVVNAGILRTTQVGLSSEKISKTVRVVQLSDLHIGPVNGETYLKNVVTKVKGLNPDIVVITGDLFDGRDHYSAKTFKSLDGLDVPTYFVTGNHEYYAGIDMVMNILNETKLHILRNENVSVDGLNIIGLDDSENSKQISKTLKKDMVSSSKYNLLLYHRPTGHDFAQEKGVDLMMVGHTHAGQIFPFNFLSAIVNSPVRGLHKYGGMYLYVSQGIGTWGPPMRLGSKSEIVVYDLKKSK